MKNDKDHLKNLINAIGTIAEMTLIFYHTLKTSGATNEEAIKLTEAYIEAFLRVCGLDTQNNGSEKSE